MGGDKDLRSGNVFKSKAPTIIHLLTSSQSGNRSMQIYVSIYRHPISPSIAFPPYAAVARLVNEPKRIAMDGRRKQGCQMAKFDPFLSLDCARVEGVGAQSKERKGSNFAA